jgi:hypothetical protein
VTKATIRQRLAVHAQNASCAACHRNIDPLGFAFDQYDAIGQWRTRERVESGQRVKIRWSMLRV